MAASAGRAKASGTLVALSWHIRRAGRCEALLAPAALPQEGAQRGGHIPGAANIPWATAVAADGCFKPRAERSNSG